MKYLKLYQDKSSAIADNGVVSPAVVVCLTNDQVAMGLQGEDDDTPLAIKQKTTSAVAKDLYLEKKTVSNSPELKTFDDDTQEIQNNEFEPFL